jgi:cytoskeletal protein RodZ
MPPRSPVSKLYSSTFPTILRYEGTEPRLTGDSSPLLSCSRKPGEGSGVGHIPRFMLLICAVMVAFVWLQACEQVSSPVKRQEKEHSVEQSIPKEADSSPVPRHTPGPTTPASTSAGASASTSASANTSSMPTEEQAAQSEASCRLANYVANANLTVEQASALSERVAERAGRRMQADSSLSAGRAKNAALDDLGVPRYPECKIGGE